MPSLASRMLELFSGSEAAHGETTVGRIGRKGKAEAKSFIKRGVLTEQMMQDHLDGKQGYGSIPIRADNMARFGALDIDTYNLDLKALNDAVRRLQLPLFLCRSKSGGAHLFLFMKDWTPASVLRESLTEMSIALGHSGCEIFPKQDTILADRGDLGNFINLPYFSAEMTTRYCYSPSGEAYDAAEFVEAAENGRVSVVEVGALDLAGSNEHFQDGPPCLRQLLAQGNGKFLTHRNSTLFQCGVYAKMKFPDTWKSATEDYNRILMNDPMDTKETLGIVDQLGKKDYYYTCNAEPFRAFCDKDLCLTQQFGVGSGDEGASRVQMTGLTVILSEPRLYYLSVNGARVELTLDQLHNQVLFQKALMSQIHFRPDTMKPRVWTNTINTLFAQATYIEVTKELTLSGQFEDLLQAFCTSGAQAMDAAELQTGKPFADGGKIKFKLEALANFLRARQFTEYTRAKMLEELKRLNGGDDPTMVQRYKKDDGSWGSVRVYFVPAYEEEQITLGVQEIQNDIPF